MEKILKESYFLSAGDTNAEHELALTVLTSKLIDIATLHANSLEIGNPCMEAMHAGWILSRLTIEMYRYPEVNSNYEVSTWIEEFNRHYSTRCFKIASKNGEALGYARSIWMVMDTENHTNLGLSHFNLDPNLVSGEKAPIDLQAKHLPIVLPNVESNEHKKFLTADYLPVTCNFQYCDLDSYRHVNTVKYVTLLLNQFSLQQHDEYKIKRLELSFLNEAKYGMNCELLRADNQNHEISSFYLQEENSKKGLMFARVFRSLR